jgi:hypothetical protein
LTQLAEYGDYHDERQGGIEADAIVGRVVPLPVRTQRPAFRRGWIVAGVAAVTVLLALAVPLLISQSTDQPPTAPEVSTSTLPSTTVVPTTTIPQVEAIAPPVLSWEPVEFGLQQGPQHGRVDVGSTLMVLQPGFEGWDDSALSDPDGDPRTILWLSDDGRQWEPHVLDQFEGTRPLLVGEAHGTYVLANHDGEGYRNYLSTDLKTWTPWSLVVTAGGMALPIRDLAATESAVVGSLGPGLVRTTPDFRGSTIIERPFGADGERGVQNIVATADMFYALVYANPGGRSEVWSSADGLEWSPALTNLPANPVDTEGNRIAEQHTAAIAANDERVLVYIDRGRQDGPFWAAESGEPFVRLHDSPTRAGDITIAATDDGFIVNFTSGFGGGDEISVFGPYATADGTTWDLAQPAGITIGSWATLDSTIFGAQGEWDVELNGGTVASERFIQNGRWMIGTTSPAG